MAQPETKKISLVTAIVLMVLTGLSGGLGVWLYILHPWANGYVPTVAFIDPTSPITNGAKVRFWVFGNSDDGNSQIQVTPSASFSSPASSYNVFKNVVTFEETLQDTKDPTVKVNCVMVKNLQSLSGLNANPAAVSPSGN